MDSDGLVLDTRLVDLDSLLANIVSCDGAVVVGTTMDGPLWFHNARMHGAPLSLGWSSYGVMVLFMSHGAVCTNVWAVAVDTGRGLGQEYVTYSTVIDRQCQTASAMASLYCLSLSLPMLWPHGVALTPSPAMDRCCAQ